MAEKNVSKFRRDERRGVLTRIPQDVAEVLPEEGELEWEVDAERATRSSSGWSRRRASRSS